MTLEDELGTDFIPAGGGVGNEMLLVGVDDQGDPVAAGFFWVSASDPGALVAARNRRCHRISLV